MNQWMFQTLGTLGLFSGMILLLDVTSISQTLILQIILK